jgi:multidrug resistance efflux pump
VLKKFVEREKQQYERLKELAANNAVSTAEVATQQSNYEISRARLEQAMRALEYHKAMVALAAAEYETALEASKKAPGAVTEFELRKLQLRVQAAEARFKELAE